MMEFEGAGVLKQQTREMNAPVKDTVKLYVEAMLSPCPVSATKGDQHRAMKVVRR